MPSRQLDMGKVYAIEQRIAEVAFVTPHKAPELLARFNEAFLDLTRHIPVVKYEQLQAKREANKRRSIVLLDLVPDLLQAKGLATAKSPAGSEDLRKAILDADDEYQDLLRRGEQLDAIVELLEGKLKAIEMAYTSVKKIIGENAYNMNNPNLKAPGDGGVIVEQRAERSSSGFGKPTY